MQKIAFFIIGLLALVTLINANSVTRKSEVKAQVNAITIEVEDSV